MGLFDPGAIFGQKNGPYERKHSNGQLDVKGTLRNGEFIGEHVVYFPNGQLKLKQYFKDQPGMVLHGPYERYFSNGKPHQLGTFKDGKLDGHYERYHENYKLMQKETYINGVPHGDCEIFRENGDLWKKGVWHFGKKCGDWIEEGRPKSYSPCGQ